MERVGRGCAHLVVTGSLKIYSIFLFLFAHMGSIDDDDEIASRFCRNLLFRSHNLFNDGNSIDERKESGGVGLEMTESWADERKESQTRRRWL